MNVDLDVIAQRGRCEVSSLRLALPLIEQGYTPPFLARYRRDELGGLEESSLWALSHAVSAQKQLEQYRDELNEVWQSTRLQDPAIGRAVASAKSRRLLDRLGRRIKAESSESSGLLNRLAIRILSPQKGDGDDIESLAASIAAKMEATKSPSDGLNASDSVTPESANPDENAGQPATSESATSEPSATGEVVTEELQLDLEKLDEALAKRISGDPRVIGAAVRWLSKNAKIHIIEVVDPHGNSGAEEDAPVKPKASGKKSKRTAEATEATEATAAAEATTPAEVAASEPVTTEPVAPVADGSTVAEVSAVDETPVAPATDSTPVAEEIVTTEPVALPADADATPAATPESATEPNAATAEVDSAEKPAKSTKKEKQAAKAPKKSKKISPRQRRRRWLVSTLKPLAGKRMPASKLSSFQIVMLGRALRSQVAQCAFDYDATKLVAELQKTVTGFNRSLGDHLAQVLVTNEAVIRDAAEGSWWDEIQEQASARLVTIAAENLHRQINRGGVEAKVVMSIDAIGPRTAATSIVSADGRLIHNEDIPCQLSAAMRTLAVTKMGELIHRYHVDLIVISNGPARRACMVALGELIKQSGEQSVRWTLADRSGADAYAGSAAGDQEMKQTPRRFRSAAWIAFSTLKPSQAMVKVDPLKLRLGSFQRELSDQAVLSALEDVLVSGAARGGVDVNSTTAAWLERLPGMNHEIATQLDKARREKLIGSREDLLARGQWPSEVHLRQALPFLRVFESEETLDGTLIHPDDYAIAKRLAKALEVELPPSSPPGYVLPNYHAPSPMTADASAESATAESATAESATAESATVESTATEETENADVASADGSPSDAPETASAASVEVSDGASAGDSNSPEPAALAGAVNGTVDSPVDDAGTPPEAAASEEAAGSGSVDAGSEVAFSKDPDEADSGDENPASPVAETVAEPVHEAVRRPKPEKAKVDKLIKEWQVGVRRSYQIVNWLCEPFGEGVVGGDPPAVMTSMPAMSELKQGDQVIGVVVGVMPFGVFVELSPECSGLIHVSRISDGYVEDLHEAVQVGDVVTAWVTGLDSKRRRVGLSAISPEREAELDSQRRDSRGGGRDGAPSRAGGNRSRGGRSGGDAGAPASGGQRGQSNRGGPTSSQGSGQNAGGQNAGGQGSGGQGSGGQGSGGRGQGGRGGDGNRGSGGNRGGGNRGGGRDGGRRDSRGASRGPRRPEVYEVVGKETESTKLTDAMQEGKEPMRSFGDLMQLFTKEKGQPEKPKPEKPQTDAPAPVVSGPAVSGPAVSGPADSGPVPAAEVTPSDSVSDESPKPSPSEAPSGGESNAPAGEAS